MKSFKAHINGGFHLQWYFETFIMVVSVFIGVSKWQNRQDSDDDPTNGAKWMDGNFCKWEVYG